MRDSVCPPELFFGRRRLLLLGMGMLGISAARLEGASTSGERMLTPPFDRAGIFPARRNLRHRLPEHLVRRDLTPREKAASHGNFSEFVPGRGGPVWKRTGAFEALPWKVEVSGECARPRVFDLDDLFAIEQEERIYHFRCVERWAMNVPWTGFPLRKLLERVHPLSTARFVGFVSACRPTEMPGVREADYLPWPYREGLRMDEAMCDLAFLATGAYGRPLLKQHGAPVRLVVPWKYGYKSPKSIVRIELTREEPRTFWRIHPHEYGFLGNVNPHLPHPRWSQETSYWLDTGESFPTPLFNGYEEQVAALYPDEPRSPQRPLRAGETAR